MIKKITTFLIIIAVIFGLYKITSQRPANTETVYDNPDLVFFWGDGCSHCEKVEEYIKSNNIDNKIKINRKEVFKNKNNSQEFKETVNKNCPEIVGTDGIGVPVAFDPITKKCYQGDTPIIDYLTEKTK